MSARIPNGIYFIHDDSWTGFRFRGGKVVASSCPELVSTFETARDSRADIVPGEDDEEITGELERRIYRACRGTGYVAWEMVTITHRKPSA